MVEGGDVVGQEMLNSLCPDQLKFQEAEVLQGIRDQDRETVGGAKRFWNL